MPWKFIEEFDSSLYIDNSVILKADPELIVERYISDSGFSIPKHSFRDTVLDEFIEVAKLGFDDQFRIFEQLNHLLLSENSVLFEKPLWSAILLRDHTKEKVHLMADIWLTNILRYSRRDQLSINLAIQQSRLDPSIFSIDNHESWFHSWPVISGRDRQRGFRRSEVTLNTPIAIIRERECSLINERDRLIVELKQVYSALERAMSENKTLVALRDQ